MAKEQIWLFFGASLLNMTVHAERPGRKKDDLLKDNTSNLLYVSSDWAIQTCRLLLFNPELIKHYLFYIKKKPTTHVEFVMWGGDKRNPCGESKSSE